jgi:hypothetical protein
VEKPVVPAYADHMEPREFKWGVDELLVVYAREKRAANMCSAAVRRTGGVPIAAGVTICPDSKHLTERQVSV